MPRSTVCTCQGSNVSPALDLNSIDLDSIFTSAVRTVSYGYACIIPQCLIRPCLSYGLASATGGPLLP